MENSGKSFLWGLGFGLCIAVSIWSSISDSHYEEIQGLQIDYDEKYSNLEAEISEAKLCISELKTMIDEARVGISSTERSLSTWDDEYETLSSAIAESRDTLSSIELSGIPGDCFPGFINP